MPVTPDLSTYKAFQPAQPFLRYFLPCTASTATKLLHHYVPPQHGGVGHDSE